jgi:hypothetical protein
VGRFAAWAGHISWDVTQLAAMTLNATRATGTVQRRHLWLVRIRLVSIKHAMYYCRKG